MQPGRVGKVGKGGKMEKKEKTEKDRKEIINKEWKRRRKDTMVHEKTEISECFTKKDIVLRDFRSETSFRARSLVCVCVCACLHLCV